MNMNPHSNFLHSNQSQMPVIKLDDNSQVPLHILENEISPEMLIPHVYITDPFPLLIGSEKGVISVENKTKPALNETTANQYPQFSNLHTVTDNSHAQTKSLVFLPNAQKTLQYYKTKPYNDVIPNSSKRYAINDQIELMHPLNYVCKSLPTNNENFQTTQSLNSVKQKLDPSLNELVNPASFINSQSNIRNFLSQPLDALTQNPLDMKINSQPLNYADKPSIKRNTDSEISSKDSNGQLNKPSVKRKVQNYVHISDVRVPQRAVAVLPTALQLRGKDNIFPRRTLPARIRFGPVEGIHKDMTPSQALDLVSKSDVPVFLMTKNDEIVHIDVSDKDKCNWMGLLPLGGIGEANVWLYQDNDELYAITTEPINARRPLKLGYSNKYAEDHKLPAGVPTLDLETVLSSNPKRWWCNECNRALPSASLLQRHADVYHKDDIISTRRGYRCLKCRRTFSRLFTLRRHIAKHCMKTTEKPADTTEPNAPLDINSLNEDNRIPSDESFQNFTNGLDFSTSLFDSDRISNLDISGNSRTDDFNPYDITFRDDTCTSNDLSFTKLTSGASNIINSEVKRESVSDAYTKCNQKVKKDSKRKHLSECPRRLECACGRSFRSNQKLAQHFLKEHQTDADTKTNPEKKKYTCEQCKTKRVSFKRRGMLVNHLWRAHKIVSTMKVERPVRHYPCVACSKIYRSAAKRDRHIDVHHPGAEKLFAQSIEGGVKSCEPAACGLCPRQYATRAKLLQHVRAQHPDAVNNAKAVKIVSPQSTETRKDKRQYTCLTTKYFN